MVRLRSLAVGVCLALLAAASSFVPIVQDWEESIDLHVLFRARGARPASDEVVLVPIDRKAARSLFLPRASADFERCRDLRLDQAPHDYRNPDPPDVLTRWPRCLHARVLNALAPGRPAVIVMDISFRPRNDPGGVFAAQDGELAAAMRRAGNVVLVLKLASEGGTSERAQPVVEVIEESAVAIAPFLLFGEQLQRVDKYCAFKEFGDWTGPCLPAIALQAASVAVYPELRELLVQAAPEDADLLPDRPEALHTGALQPSVRLIRHIASAHRHAAEGMRAQLASGRSTHSAATRERLHRLIDVYDGAGQRYFNYYGPPGAFATLRYERLAAGMDVAPESLRGKAVFIGFAEYDQPEASEHFATPFSTAGGIKPSGVELAATAYANLLDGSSLVTPAYWQRALVTFSLGVFCALLFAVLSLPFAVAMCLLLWTAYLGAALSVFGHYALWLPLLIPLGVCVPATAGAGLYLELTRQRDRTRRALAALLPARLVDRIIDRNEELAQLRESVYGACVFTDMQRYTALFRDHSPDEVARLLDTYFEALFPVVQRVGGETIDVLGDAMLALWAGRDPDAKLRERACTAALQLAAAAERFRDDHADVAVRTRIGVDFGRMTLGMVGSALHLEYRPVGEPPNIAARLQELGKHLGAPLLVSEAVIVGLERFVARDLGLFLLREAPRPTRVYALMSERDGVTGRILDLCAAFASALADYHAGRRAEAARGFEALQRDYPDDGPSRFYGTLCGKGTFLGTAPIPAAGIPYTQL